MKYTKKEAMYRNSVWKLTSRGTALLVSTTRPSMLCGLLDMASSTIFDSEYVMKPNPRDLLVTGSFMTTTSTISPHCSKKAFRLSSLVLQSRPPMKSFLRDSGSEQLLSCGSKKQKWMFQFFFSFFNIIVFHNITYSVHVQ